MDDDPTYDIAIVRETGSGERELIADAPLKKAITATLRRHNTPAAIISVALVDDLRIAELNRRHLGHDGPTDVLAFDLRDAADQDDSNGDGFLRGELEGDVVISVETAMREARRRGHEPDAEVALYAVHGILHLLGYDDHQDRDAARMHVVEDEILASVGWGPVFKAEPK